jgi:hypothetical protein
MRINVFAAFLIAGIAISGTSGLAQSRAGGGGRGVALVDPGTALKITESAPIEVTPVKNAPFSAQAVTEFTQTFGDGNRIERSYQSSIARDSRGRTRREEEIALIGPLAAANAGVPRLVTIIDPDSGAGYTLDDDRRVAYRSLRARSVKIIELDKLEQTLNRTNAARANADEQVIVQDLGVRTIEGLRAQGTRTTTTIAAGAIGNLQAINIVSERWFSPELQMAVLVTRRDPRNGDTIYRLTNVQRGEQPDTLFTVPSSYEVVDGDLKFKLVEGIVEKAKKFKVRRSF